VRLQADASAPRRARQYVQSHCQHLPVETLHVVKLLTSELVTNAVVHGAGEAVLDVLAEGNIMTVGVSDHGGGSVRAASRFSWPETGHGLTLVAGMADRWGVDQVPGTPGKRVWFELTWRTDEA
jgi:anti-sigma regulatory factor (Ser/Thr protein kinase)